MLTPTLSRPRGVGGDEYSGSKRDLLYSQQSNTSISGNNGSDVKIREISRRRKQAGALKSAVKNTESSKLRNSSSSTTSSMYDDEERGTEIGSTIIGNQSSVDCLDSRSSFSSLENKVANMNGLSVVNSNKNNNENGNGNRVSKRYNNKIHQNDTNDEYKNEYDDENENENEGSKYDDASQVTDPEEPVAQENTGSIFSYFNFSSFYS